MSYIYKKGKPKESGFTHPVRDAVKKVVKKVVKTAAAPANALLDVYEKRSKEIDVNRKQKNQQMILDTYGTMENYEKSLKEQQGRSKGPKVAKKGSVRRK